jgi:hypothetical protein
VNITEINRVNQGGVRLSRLKRDGEQPAGFNGDIDGFAFFKNLQDGFQTYYLIDDGEIVAATAGKVKIINNKKYYQINGVSVLPRYRGMHLAIKMYHAIMHSDGYQLMSDSKQTPDGEKLWQKLSKSFSIRVMELPSGDIISNNPLDAYDESESTVLVTEDNLRLESILIPPLKIK